MTDASLPESSHSPWRRNLSSVISTINQSNEQRGRAALSAFFFVAAAALIFLQKFAITYNPRSFGLPIDGGPVEMVLPIFYAAFGVTCFFHPPKIDVGRLILAVVFVVMSALGVLLQNNTYSSNSLFLMYVIYLPFVFYFETSSALFRRMMAIYLNLMLGIGGIVIIEHIVQFLSSSKYLIDLDAIIPHQFLWEGYVYKQPIVYGSKYMKPNAIFFLEVSYLSQFIAVALAIELVFFRRLWRLVFYSGLLISTFAGTGVLLLAVTFPVLLSRLNLRTLGMVAIVMSLTAALAVSINWYGQVQNRFGEYKRVGTSANYRFVTPYIALQRVLSRPHSLYTGSGPGSGPREGQEFWWVSAKIAHEYGFLTVFAFEAFMGWVLFANAPSKRIGLVLFVLLNFMAGFIIPVYPLFIYLLGGAFRIKQPIPK